MANAHGVQESGGIKLFGTTITLSTRQQEVVKNEQHTSNNDQILLEMRRPDKIIPCPRCKSMETKFCYFNNYNVNQPRHFCKGCQRYWTAGGALRNVPVGAGRRKSKPPCRGLNGAGFPDNCLYDDATQGQQCGFDLEGVVENWYVMGQGSFRQVFPAKRRRNCIDDQSC